MLISVRSTSSRLTFNAKKHLNNFLFETFLIDYFGLSRIILSDFPGANMPLTYQLLMLP